MCSGVCLSGKVSAWECASVRTYVCVCVCVCVCARAFAWAGGLLCGCVSECLFVTVCGVVCRGSVCVCVCGWVSERQ